MVFYAVLQDQRRQLVVSHERYVEEVTRDFEQRLEDDRDARVKQEEQKAEIKRELAETEAQLEDDVDTEVSRTTFCCFTLSNIYLF